MKNLNHKGGISILGLIVLIIGVILLINYFHIHIKVTSENPAGEQTITQSETKIQIFWNTYIEIPISYAWNDLWLPVWRPFIANLSHTMDNLRESSKTSSKASSKGKSK